VNRQKLKVGIRGLELRNCNLEGCAEGIGPRISPLEQGAEEGESPVVGEAPAVRAPSKGRVVWDCSPKWEIHFFRMFESLSE
jgi:hypothetical protein